MKVDSYYFWSGDRKHLSHEQNGLLLNVVDLGVGDVCDLLGLFYHFANRFQVSLELGELSVFLLERLICELLHHPCNLSRLGMELWHLRFSVDLHIFS